MLNLTENVNRLLKEKSGKIIYDGNEISYQNDNRTVHNCRILQKDEIIQDNKEAKRNKTSHNRGIDAEAELAGKAYDQDAILSPYEPMLFQSEGSIPKLKVEDELIYEADHFQHNIKSTEKPITPPPNFQITLSHFPKNLQTAFKEILNADIVGIWPIKQDILR